MKINGLTEDEVKMRILNNQVNYQTDIKTKAVSQIIFTNFFTLFNLLNLSIAFIIFLVGSYKNLLFLGVVISNTIISTFQEIKSKKIIDRLSLLNEANVILIRDGKEIKTDIYNIVLDDIIKLKMGNQVPTDSTIIKGEILVNESLITGEADAILKKENDELLSGSFVVSGNCFAKVIHVGEDNYTSKISLEAKYLKKVNSELMNFINKVIKWVSIAIIPIGILLFINQYTLSDNNLQTAAVNVCAALIGMIPEGLVLLTSTVLALSVIRLSKYNVLVQELFCIENLARVDIICLDKTGTLTKGKMKVKKIVPLNCKKSEMIDILHKITYHMDSCNQTIKTIKEKYDLKNDLEVFKTVPFDSIKKWSGISFENESYILGAPDIISVISIDEYAKKYRVVMLAKSKKMLSGKLPSDIKVVGLILIEDELRTSALETLAFLKKEGIDVKIISGDNTKTISSVANNLHFDKINEIDMQTNKRKIIDICENHNIFGRVKPDEKKKIILALKEKGHTVAYIGDGINDVLALKEADCSIAMNSGSDASRNVSQIVLLDDNFASMENIISEGRRSVNNLQRSSSLFLCKTIYASLLALIFVFLNDNYPFIPIQLSLTSMVTIGIPSFVLALEPNNEKIKGRILNNVIKNSVPTALTIVLGILFLYFFKSFLLIDDKTISTICLLLTGSTGFMLLFKICSPFNLLRKILFVSVILIFVLFVVGLSDFFQLVITPYVFLIFITFFMVQLTLFSFLSLSFEKMFDKRN